MDTNESTSTGDILIGCLSLLLAVVLAPFLAQWFIKGVLAGDVKGIKAKTFDNNTCVMSRDGGVFESKDLFETEFYLEYTLNANQFNVNCYEELVEDMEQEENAYLLVRRPDYAMVKMEGATYKFEIPASKELVNEANVATLLTKIKDK